jgi:type IV secretory pathway VirB3-like protein
MRLRSEEIMLERNILADILRCWSMMLAVHLFFIAYLIQQQNNKLTDLHLAAFFWLYEHQEAIAQRIWGFTTY